MSGWRRGGAVVAVVLAVATIGGGVLRPDATEVVAEFPRAFNVFPGSDVRLLGVRVGRVADVTASEGSGVVRARLRVDDGVILPADVEAHVVQGSLLGERFVQLGPAYTGGPSLPPGATIPVERTSVPAEFDEILESLNDVLVAIPPDELSRLVRSTAEIVDGRGDRIGDTLDDVAIAVAALREADDDLVSLIGQLADLNATLATRDQGIEDLISDHAVLMTTLAEERRTIDAALAGVASAVLELRHVTEAHAGRLDDTVEGVTRVGRTLSRNLDRLHLTLEGQSELFRHAERVMDLEHNWLPLVNHSEDLGRMIQDRLTERLMGLCERLEHRDCAAAAWWEEELPDSVCIPGVVACRRDAGPGGTGVDEITVDAALRHAVARVPELLAEIGTVGGAAPRPPADAAFRGGPLP